MTGSGTESKRPLNEVIAQTPPAVKLLAIGGIGAILLVLILGGQWRSQSAITPLFGESKFSNQELQRLQLSLSRSGLTGFSIRNGQLLVPSTLISKCMKVLDEDDAIPPGIKPARLPPPEISPFVSRYQQQLQQQYQKKLVLQQMLRRLTFVADAALEIDFGTTESSRSESSPTRCTAVILTVDSRILKQQELETLQQMLLGSISNLERTGLVIVDQAAGIAYDHLLIGQPQTAAQTAAITKLRLVQSLEQAIRQALGDQKDLQVTVTCPDLTTVSESASVQPPSMLASHATIPGSNGIAAVAATDLAPPGISKLGESFCPLVNIRISPQSDPGLAASPAEQERLRSEIVQKVRPLLPENAFRPDGPFPIAVEIDSLGLRNDTASARSWFGFIGSQNNGWLIALLSSICLALFFLGSLRKGKSASTMESGARQEDIADSDEHQIDLQNRIDSLLRNNPDTAAQVIRDWIQKAA